MWPARTVAQSSGGQPSCDPEVRSQGSEHTAQPCWPSHGVVRQPSSGLCLWVGKDRVSKEREPWRREGGEGGSPVHLRIPSPDCT